MPLGIANRRALGAQPTLIYQALTLLNRLGTDVNVYVPGINGGRLNGIEIADYLESTGVTAATVDGLVGRVNSTVQGFGSELTTAGEFDTLTGWTQVMTGNAVATVSGGRVTLNPVDAAGISRIRESFPSVVGKTYRVKFVGVSDTGAAATLTCGTSGGGSEYFGVPAASNSTTYSQDVVATSTTMWISYYKTGAGSLGTYVGESVSVKEVLGIHATQSTAGSRPTMRNGPYSLEFDGTTDYLSLSAVPFQMSDDHFAIACVKPNIADAAHDVFTIRNSGVSNVLIACMTLREGIFLTRWRDDAGTEVALNTATFTANETFVYSADKVGNVVRERKNGATTQTGDTSALGATTPNNATLGASIISAPIQFLSGNGIIWIIGKRPAWFTDANLKTLERFAGLFGGVSVP